MDSKKLDTLIEKSNKPEKMKKIIDKLHDCGFSDSYMTGRELKKLPDLIGDNETIKYAASGFYDENSSSVLIVVTNKRVLLENKKLLFGSQNSEIPLTMINNVSYNSGLIMAKVFITSGTKTHKITSVPKALVEGLTKTIRVESERERERNQSQSSNQSNDDIDELRKLKKLVEENVITEEEFEAKKKQILNL